MGLELVCCVAMGDQALHHHLMPLVAHPSIEKLWIVRHAEISTGPIPKAEYVLVPDRFKPVRFWKMIRVCRELVRREEVKGFISFNPFPYGLFSLWAAKKQGKAVHFGFMVSDWNLKVSGFGGRKLLSWSRQADFITCTGPTMQNQMIARGLDGERIAVLPHTIDLERYRPGNPEQADYACVFVGRLIPLKQVDVILRAWARLAEKFPAARFAVVGDGPLLEDMKKLAGKLGIAAKVDFPGFVSDLVPVYARAKIIVIASTHEGFPFVLTEAMACGLVPITTPAGTIPDHIHHNENGLLFPIGNATALADHIVSLLNDPALYNRLRENVLQERLRFARATAMAVWDKWLQTLQ